MALTIVCAFARFSDLNLFSLYHVGEKKFNVLYVKIDLLIIAAPDVYISHASPSPLSLLS
jgi:hypothetical protein